MRVERNDMGSQVTRVSFWLEVLVAVVVVRFVVGCF